MVKRVSRSRNLLSSADLDNRLWSNQFPSSEESSESEFIEEEKPWPPPFTHQSRSKTLTRQVTRHTARPQSHLFKRGSGDGQERRGRHSRRWENSAFLSSLYSLPENEPLTTLLPEHHTPLTQLHSSDKYMQIWTSFSSRSEEEQRKILESESHDGVKRVPSDVRQEEHEPIASRTSAQERLQKIDRRIRSILQYNHHLPTELLFELEEELRFLFSVDVGAVVLSTHPHSFSRLLLHGLCQFLGLSSTTVDCEGVSVVMIVCRATNYSPPVCWLSSYLKTK